MLHSTISDMSLLCGACVYVEHSRSNEKHVMWQECTYGFFAYTLHNKTLRSSSCLYFVSSWERPWSYWARRRIMLQNLHTVSIQKIQLHCKWKAHVISFQMHISPYNFMVGVKSCYRISEDWSTWFEPAWEYPRSIIALHFWCDKCTPLHWIPLTLNEHNIWLQPRKDMGWNTFESLKVFSHQCLMSDMIQFVLFFSRNIQQISCIVCIDTWHSLSWDSLFYASENTEVTVR